MNKERRDAEAKEADARAQVQPSDHKDEATLENDSSMAVPATRDDEATTQPSDYGSKAAQENIGDADASGGREVTDEKSKLLG